MFGRLTLDLHWVFISLLIKYCTAEVVIVKVVRTASVNLTDFIKCDDWLLETHELSKPLVMDDIFSGAYKCPSSNDAVLLLVYGGFQFVSKFEGQDNVKLNYGLVGDNITVACFLEIYPGNLSMTNSLTISDEDNNQLKKQMAQAEPNFEPVDSYAEIYEIVTKPGNLTHYCEWNVEVEYEGSKYKDAEKKFATVLVFLPVSNAKPDKTKVNTGEQVRCIAEGYPPPDQFFWQCNSFSSKEDGWEAEKDVLTFTQPKEFVCQCMASNDVAGHIHSTVWNGTIEAIGEPKLPKEGKKKKVTVKKKVGKKDEEVDDDGDEEEDEAEKAPRTKRPVGSGAISAHDQSVDGMLLLLCSAAMVASSKILQLSVINSPIPPRKAW